MNSRSVKLKKLVAAEAEWLNVLFSTCCTLYRIVTVQSSTLNPLFLPHYNPDHMPSLTPFWDPLGMFGNCFFLLFSIFKNNFLFLRLKNLFGNSKRAKNKNCFQNSICEENWKHAKCSFQFLIFKSQWKHAFNLKNLFHLMS